MTELRPKTADEVAKARFFDVYGGEPLSPGSSALQGEGLRSAIPANYPRPSYSDFLSRVVCAARAVVVGRAQPKNIRLNSKATFLFTTYDLEVDRWVYPESGRPALSLAVAGGSALIDGKLTVARDVEPVAADKLQLFVLTHIPGSGALSPMRPVFGADSSPKEAWAALYLPHELTDGSDTWYTLLEDLKQTGRACKKAGRQ